MKGKNGVISLFDKVQVFAISFSLLFLETSLFHILNFTHNHLEATLLISYALLGLGLGSLISHKIINYTKEKFSIFLTLFIIATIFSVLNITRFPSFIFLSPFLVLPFLFANIVLTYFFRKYRSNTIYFIDLLGASLAVFLSLYLIPLFSVENAIAIILITLLILAILSAKGLKHNSLFLQFFLLLLLLGLVGAFTYNIQTEKLSLEYSTKCYDDSYPRKIFCLPEHSDNKTTYEIKEIKDNLVARVSVYNRTADGKSTIFVNYEGYSNDRITGGSPVAWRNDLRVPFMYSAQNMEQHRIFTQDPDVLVIGTAAQGIVKPIKYLVGNISKIDGLELNPGPIELMQNEYLEYSAYAYENLSVTQIDARTYLQYQNKTYSLITLLNTYKTGSIAKVGQAEFLHTKDAMLEYFNHLEANGFLLFEERGYADESGKLSIFRLINNIQTALEEKGSINPSEHFFIYNWKPSQNPNGKDWYTMIVVKKTALTQEEKDYFKEWYDYQHLREYVFNTSTTHVQIEYLPGEELNNTLFTDFFASEDKLTFFGEGKDLSVTTDDKPFIHAVYTNSPILVERLFKLSLLCLFLLLIPIFMLKKTKKLKASIPFFLIFAFLGLGYFIIESTLMKLYQNYMGSPEVSLIIVLALLLFSSGLGAYFSRNFSQKTLIISYLCVYIISILHIVLISKLMKTITFSHEFALIFLVVSLFPLGFFMGVPFPHALEQAKKKLGDTSAIFYAVNSIFGAFAFFFGLVLSVYLGLKTSFLLGALAYMFALFILYYYTKEKHSQKD
ncbi:MAG: hypothetical protein H6500_03495 [Candidatus Woesearchaeota archaeon]|nr:MAG: hypothetical protein H6500_03495 [Candidatus Woesearchaeota archaeon]